MVDVRQRLTRELRVCHSHRAKRVDDLVRAISDVLQIDQRIDDLLTQLADEIRG